jgi:hypothetical protein
MVVSLAAKIGLNKLVQDELGNLVKSASIRGGPMESS